MYGGCVATYVTSFRDVFHRFSPFNCVVLKLDKGACSRTFACFVLINSVILILLCVWIFREWPRATLILSLGAASCGRLVAIAAACTTFGIDCVFRVFLLSVVWPVDGRQRLCLCLESFCFRSYGL